MKTVRVLIALCALLMAMACGEGPSGGNLEPAPAAGVIRYRLDKESSIVFLGPEDSTRPAQMEKLSGVLDLAYTHNPNTFFSFSIQRLALSSASFAVKMVLPGTQLSISTNLRFHVRSSSNGLMLGGGDRGFVEANTLSILGDLVAIQIAAVINGNEVELNGRGNQGTFAGSESGVKLTGLSASGGGYTITIFAAPDD